MKQPFIAFLFACLAASASAQFTATITVTDNTTGLPVENATVELDGTFAFTDASGEVLFIELADETYAYSVTAPCYNSGSGSIIIAGENAAASLALEPLNTNTVFFFIGSPLAIPGATVTLTDGMDYNDSFVTSFGIDGDNIQGVPYGEISYTISLPCYETITGTVTVECNNGDGIAVFAEPVAITTNTVFFFIGSPLAIPGATVTLTDGMDYNDSFVTSFGTDGDNIQGVPYGEISYTISLPCYETITGTVTVECNNGDGIAVFAEPTPIEIDATVTAAGATLTATAADMDYQWVDCNNNNEPIDGAEGQSFTATENGDYAVIITNGDCAQTSACTAVVVTGVEDLDNSTAFTAYPNPFTEQLWVRNSGELGTTRMELFNVSGQVLMDETRSGTALMSVPTIDLPPGSYVLRLTTGNTRTSVHVVK